MKKTSIKYRIFALLFLNTFITTNAQNPIFSLPPKWYDFSGPPINLPTNIGITDYHGDPAFGCHNSMIDANGNLKFFVIDQSVYDNTGHIFINGDMYDNSSGDVMGSQEICIIPDPGNCTKYYIISSATIDFQTWYPTYAIADVSNYSLQMLGTSTAIDMRGMMTSGSPYTWGEDDATNIYQTRPGIATTPQKPDGSYLLFIHDGVRHIYRFKITSSGIFYETVIDIQPLFFHDEFDQWNRAEMEIIELAGGNYRLATCYIGAKQLAEYLVPEPVVYLTDLDANGDPIAGTQNYVTYTTTTDVVGTPPFDILVWESTFIHGLEFSPDGRYLYVSHEKIDFLGSQPNPIEVIDCQASTPISIPIANPVDAEPFEFSQLELGIDGKIYAANSTSMVSLLTPNIPSSSNWNFATPIPISYNYTDEFSSLTRLKSYTLPDQLDAEDYDQQFNTEACCFETYAYDKLNFTANSADINWTPGSNPLVALGNTAYIRDEIIIPQDLTITISNMNLLFAPGGKITVERGASGHKGGVLILNSCTLSIAPICSSPAMWNGIEVQGYSNLSQAPITNTRQGQLRATNSKIEHAYVGILAGKFATIDPSTHTFIADVTSGGSIIRTNNSTIENCYINLWFAQFTYADNSSNIFKTKFRTTQTLNDPTYSPAYMVLCVGNSGTKFRGNEFNNTAPSLFAQNLRGIGILGIGSKLYLDAGVLTPYTPNTFTNLWYGVAATTTLGLKPVYSDRSVFTNVFHGIYLSGSNYSTLTSNIFDIPLDPVFSPTDKPYGVFLTGCTGYKVEGNDFHSPNSTTFNYGIIVDNSGIVNNQVYRNNFSNLYIGAQSQNINGSTPGGIFVKGSGLRWRCNVFSNINRADLSYASGRIAQWQGTCPTQPASNAFSENNSATTDHDFANNPIPAVLTNPIYYPNWIAFPYIFNNYNPFYFNALSGCGSGGLNCSSTLGPYSSTTIPSHRILMRNASAEISNLLVQIDGGNTQTLLNAINTYSNGNLKNLLMSKSPYLSDEVLLAYINRNSTPNGHLKEVVIANSPVTTEVYDLIVSKNLPNGIMNQINAAQTGVSQRQQLYGTVDIFHAERNENMNEIIRIFLNDTIIINPLDSVIAILEQEVATYPELKEVLAMAAMEKGDDVKLLSVKNDIIASDGYTNFCKFIDASTTIGSICNIKHAMQTNPSLKTQIENIAYDEIDLRNSFYGKNIIWAAEDIFFAGVIEPLLEDETRNISISQPENENIGDAEIFIYPNPAANSVTIQLPDELDSENVVAYLSNALGQSIDYRKFEGNLTTVFDIHQLSNGIYVVSIINNGNTLSVQKLIINH